MTVYEMQQEILRLKKENDACILAHAYQGQEILDVADYVGDSYGLSVQAAKDRHRTVVMCGVRFMAETCKVLSPEKTVILSHAEAGCPMADQMDKEDIQAILPEYPGYGGGVLYQHHLQPQDHLRCVCDLLFGGEDRPGHAPEGHSVHPRPEPGPVCGKAGAGEEHPVRKRRLSLSWPPDCGGCGKCPEAASRGLAAGTSRVSAGGV